MQPTTKPCRTCDTPTSTTELKAGYCRKCRYEYAKAQLGDKWIQWQSDGTPPPEQADQDFNCRDCGAEVKAGETKWGRCWVCRHQHWLNKQGGNVQ